jgi:glycosyltransferase involved in cell wall biosynthesis
MMSFADLPYTGKMGPGGTGLPRLIYMADVPIEASYHGSALMCRLLQDYPKDRLTVVETGRSASLEEGRIDGVPYRADLMLLERLSRSRLHGIHQSALLKLASIRSVAWMGFARQFGAEAILTVSHGVGWITAATLARKLGLPLHLICHDEWARAGILQEWKDRVLGDHYRHAASRLCVSPFMVEEYERRYSAPGEVLYPSRAVDAPRYDGPPARLADQGAGITAVFAGTINSSGMAAALRTLAVTLAKRAGRLQVYGPLTTEQARAVGLDGVNIENRGLVSSPELMTRMRADADVLYVPMSFAEPDRNNMKINFPSKLTDYSAVGVPLLIHGPVYSSAVRWARDNEGVAEVVTDADCNGLDAAISRLSERPAHRMALGAAALEVGARYFSYEVARDAFLAALRRGQTMAQPASRTVATLRA